MLETEQAFQNWQAIVVGYICAWLPIAVIIKMGGSLHSSHGLGLGSGQENQYYLMPDQACFMIISGIRYFDQG